MFNFDPIENWNSSDIRIASFDVDPQRGFSPLCPNELPVPNGHMIVDALNEQAKLASIRIVSCDCHPPNAVWLADEKHPQLSPIIGYQNCDLYWNSHCIIGTEGAALLPGLPSISQYNFVVYKGLERDMHPYGACYHDLAEKKTTGVIEFLRVQKVDAILVGGLCENYCVATTAMQLAKAGFKVFVNLDATRYLGDPTAEREKMKNDGIVLLNTLADFSVKNILQTTPYYVYIYFDPRKQGNFEYEGLTFPYEPFYVGKGIRNRYRMHLSHSLDENPYKANKIKKIITEGLKPLIIIYAKYLTDGNAKKLEKELIKKIGRGQKGPLTNLTDGGDGSEGFRHTPEVKHRLSELRKGQLPWNKGLTAETDARVKVNALASSKTRRELGLGKGEKNYHWGKRGELSPSYGIKRTQEQKAKYAQSKFGNQNPQSKLMHILTPDGFDIITSAADFERQYGSKYNISRHFLYTLANSRRVRDGWRVYFVGDSIATITYEDDIW